MASFGGSLTRDKASERMRERARKAILDSPAAETALAKRRKAEAETATKARRTAQEEKSAIRRADDARAKAFKGEDLGPFPYIPGPRGEAREYIKPEQDRLLAERQRTREQTRARPDKWGNHSSIGMRDVLQPSAGGRIVRREKEKERAKNLAELKEQIFGSNPDDPKTRAFPQPGAIPYGTKGVPPHPAWTEQLRHWHNIFSERMLKNVLNLPEETQMGLLKELEKAEEDLLTRFTEVPILRTGKSAPGERMKPFLYGVGRAAARKISPTRVPMKGLLRQFEEGNPEEFDAYLKELARVRTYRQALLDQMPVHMKRELEDWKGGEGHKKTVERALIEQLAGKGGRG